MKQAELEIRARLADATCDRPAVEAGKAGSPLQAQPHWLDSLCHWYGTTYHVDPRTTLDVPFARIWQLRRTLAIHAGEDVIDPIHARLGEAMRRQMRPSGRN